MNENNKKPNQEIKDSGSMQTWDTGARRDAPKNGDCSLIPLTYAAMMMNDPVLANIGKFMEERTVNYLAAALQESVKTVPVFRYDEVLKKMKDKNIEMSEFETDDEKMQACYADMLLEVSELYLAGAKKYGKNNYQLGIPVNRYLDSGVRHYLKTLRGDVDEPHYRGFIWNLLCAMWTAEHLPELNFRDDPKRPDKE